MPHPWPKGKGRLVINATEYRVYISMPIQHFRGDGIARATVALAERSFPTAL